MLIQLFQIITNYRYNHYKTKEYFIIYLYRIVLYTYWYTF